MKERGIRRNILLLLLFIVLLCAFLYLLLPYLLHNEFYKAGERVQKIPGLYGDFVPQGVTATDDGTIIICGYSQKSGPSRIYRLYGDGKYSVLYLENEDGSPYKGHAGGITAQGDYIYISNASKIFILRCKDVLEAKDGSFISFIDHFSVPCRSSFCSSDEEYLLVGEYHAPGYDTEESHRVQVDGGVYEAITFAYKLDKQGKAFGEPSFAFSTCDKVQGFAIFEDKAVLSVSSGLRESRILFYSIVGNDDTFKIDGKEIPLIILHKERLIHEISAPHMSEDVEYRNGSLLIAFEGGARKYGMGFVPCSEKSVIRLYPSLLLDEK